jgi:hypothetical protein
LEPKEFTTENILSMEYDYLYYWGVIWQKKFQFLYHI